jgi:predicted dehydrogenase
MKLILVGVGSFGRGWYRDIKERHAELQVAVVDQDPAARQVVDPTDRFYTSLVEAIEQERPDFLINVSPPQAHTQVNAIAFDHRLPVLCEKPIAEDWEQAVAIVRRATAEGIPFMIAENYRRSAVMRKARRLIEAGEIGQVRSLHCSHHKFLYTEKPYFLQMQHPYLVDVVVHHLDLFRYLSGSEGEWVFARSYHPEGSWHTGCLALDLLMQMRSGAMASFNGSLATRGVETTWNGDWRIEGALGMIAIQDDQLTLFRQEKAILMDEARDIEAPNCLDDFLQALRDQSEPKTSGRDYLKTQALVHSALQASQTGQVIQVALLD